MERIGFILTAGQRREVFFLGYKLPKIFSWPPIRSIILRLGGKIKHIPELKEETKARINIAAELFKRGAIDIIFVSGGYIEGKFPDITKKYLLSLNVPEEKIQTALKSMDTIGNVEELIGFLGNRENFPEIVIITSHYHIFRAKKAFSKVAESGSEFVISTRKAYPPLTYNCLVEEYLYNLLSEPFKVLLGNLSFIRKRHLAAEMKARKQ